MYFPTTCGHGVKLLMAQNLYWALFTDSVVKSQGTQHGMALGEADEVKQGPTLTPAKWRALTYLGQYSIQERLPHSLDKQGWAELYGLRGRLSLHIIPQQ